MPEGVRKGTLYTLIGLGASGLLLFLFNMLAARMLGPSGFGILSVVYSLITTITPLLAGGINIGVIRFISVFEAKGEREKIQGTMKDGLVLWASFSLLALAVILILKDFIIAKYLDQNSFLFLVLILSTLFYSLLILVRSILSGLRELKLNAVTMIVQYSFMVLFLWGFVILLNLGVNGAAASLFSAALVSLIVTILICSTVKSRFIGSKSKGNLRMFFNFAGPVTLSNFLMYLLLRCGPLLIKTLGGLEANKLAGLFASVFALVGVVRMAVSALGTALFPNLSRADALENIELQKRYIKKSILVVSGLCLLMIIGFWCFGPAIIKIVYGKEFAMRRLDILLIAAMGSLFFLAALLNNILLAKNHVRDVLICWSVAGLVLISSVWLIRISPLLRVETSLCLANFAAFVSMLLMLRRALHVAKS